MAYGDGGAHDQVLRMRESDSDANVRTFPFEKILSKKNMLVILSTLIIV